ncbi:MAG: BamA/TamA family outer membrane protein [Pseudomonadota bacterium]
MSHSRFLRMALGVISYLIFNVCFAAEPTVPGKLASSQTESSAVQSKTDEAEPPSDQDLLTSTATTPQLTSFQLGIAKGEWAGLIRQHIPELSASAEAQSLTPGVLRKLRRQISSILSTEGYFSPLIGFKKNTGNTNIVLVNIDAGARTTIQDLEIQFSGALEDAAKLGQGQALARKESLIANWSLPNGAAFRDSEWASAKNQLSENLHNDNYAAATILDSEAVIDADSHTASLRVEVDSGPSFVLGEINVNGLQRYPASLLERFEPPKKGEAYSRTRLLEYQRALQNSAYFSTVAVSVEADPLKADAVPIEVEVVERKARDLALGAGYSTNTGFRTEVSYRDRNVFENAWDLRSAVRLEQRRQLAYADIYLPPRTRDQLDSFGVLVDRLDVSGLLQNRSALGIKRTNNLGYFEQRMGLNFTLEKNQPDGERERFSRALVASFGWTWRAVDDQFAPRKGQIVQADIAVSEKAVVSDQRFIRLFGKLQRWIPFGKEDSVILRAEAGQMFSAGLTGIPEDYLFRTGGSSSVRGYRYQSLGIQHPASVTGGRVMATASAEYVHWYGSNLGSAAFLDIGDAADSWPSYHAKQGLGVGLRYKTPAGPLALDLAYGKQSKKLRLDVSIAIAF